MSSGGGGERKVVSLLEGRKLSSLGEGERGRLSPSDVSRKKNDVEQTG